MIFCSDSICTRHDCPRQNVNRRSQKHAFSHDSASVKSTTPCQNGTYATRNETPRLRMQLTRMLSKLGHKLQNHHEWSARLWMLMSMRSATLGCSSSEGFELALIEISSAGMSLPLVSMATPLAAIWKSVTLAKPCATVSLAFSKALILRPSPRICSRWSK